MPGGYDSYLASLRRTADHVVAARPEPQRLQSWMCKQFEITAQSAYDRWNSLRRAGFITAVDGVCFPSGTCRAWLSDDDPAPLIAELHSNIRLVGELLALLGVPLSINELLHSANKHYLDG